MARFWGSLILAAAAAPVATVLAQTNDSELAAVTMMDTGSFHTVVIIRDSMVNVVKDWGANGKGQLGLNDTKDRGDNDGDVGDLLPEVVLSTTVRATSVTAGLRHTAAIMDDGSIRSWGYNAKGQLGVGSVGAVGDQANEMGDNMVVTPLGDDVSPVSIHAGGWHTCAIVDEDRLKCWGYNQWGELGLEDQDDRGDEPNEMGDNLPYVDLGDDVSVKSIALGDWHTCALIDDGEVKCWGKNYAGQLGLDDTENRGDEDGEMGDSLDTVDLGGKRAEAIACGEEHTCAILEDGELRCWGLGSSGQLGQGSPQNVGDADGDMADLVSIDLGTGRTAIEVAAGGNHTCARLDNDDIKCWGENEYGELGQGDTISRGSAPNQMGDLLSPIDVGTGRTLHSLAAGYYHTCALVDEADEVTAVLCWGANFNGQMGLGISETEHIGDEPGEMGDNLQTANLGGEHMEERGDKWYEQTWFYIACGVVGGILLCCLCILCKYAHGGDNSGRGPKPYVAARPAPPGPSAPAKASPIAGPSPDGAAAVGAKPPAATAPVATPPTPGDDQA